MLLLDTNVISELRKIKLGRADLNVSKWAERVNPSDLYVSAITIHELEVGILRLERRDARQGSALRVWLEQHVLTTFAGRILPVDTAVAMRGAQLQVPDPHPVQDGLIAATALVHGLIVVTRNVEDFASTGVRVLNPWDAA
jgi:predicted nucleic acid-binding protein